MKCGPDMEPSARIKAVTENASGITINPTVKATHYVRSGKEMLRSAVNYHEDNNPENAFILYMRFLTIFLDKLRTHPGYKEIPPAEKKLMTSYCNDILPKAEILRTELLKRYEVEYEQYQLELKESLERAKRDAEEEAKNKEKFAQLPNDLNISKWQTIPNSSNFPNVPTPKQTGISSGLSGISYSNILHDDTNNLPGPSAPPGSSLPQQHPQFDRNTKPSRFLSPMSSGLRQVVVPDDLIPTFLQCADKNTKNNIETCGFLTGSISGGKLIITDLIIPKQKGTPDSCDAQGEVEYSMIQDRLNLITFGWIHTHPSQTAFLSSVDMHTQYWYQQMMPEAIAIVCAPKKNQYMTFFLNPGEGMEIIGNCQETGFHQHRQGMNPLFIEATHSVFDKSRSVKVHDLR